MNTKTITIKATDVALDLIHKRESGVPFGWLQSVVQKVLERVPEAEETSLKIHGLEGVSFTYEHRLTEVEVLAEKVAALESKLQAVRGLLPASGPVSIDGERLREILG